MSQLSDRAQDMCAPEEEVVMPVDELLVPVTPRRSTSQNRNPPIFPTGSQSANPFASYPPTIPSLFHSPMRDFAATLPPSSDGLDGLVISSPIRGTKAEKASSRRKKGYRQRGTTMKLKKEALVMGADQSKKDAAMSMQNHFDQTLEALSDKGYTFYQLMLHVFDPAKKNKHVRWAGFFNIPGAAARILDLWTAGSNTDRARGIVHRWTLAYVMNLLRQEARAITSAGWLQSLNQPINAACVLGFDMKKQYMRLREDASTAMQIFAAFATGPRHEKVTEQRKLKKEMIVTSAALSLLGEYSHSNNYPKRIMSIYMYASGAQSQVISVMSHLGLCESYANLIAKESKPRPPKAPAPAPTLADTTPGPTPISSLAPRAAPSDIISPTPDAHEPDNITPLPTQKPGKVRRAGTLRSLSLNMRISARTVASTGLFATIYDNINMVFRVAEQILGRNDSQENGTCATIFPLWMAKPEDLQLSDLVASFDAAPPLSIEDILLNPEETKFFNDALVHCIARIIVTHGGEDFKHHREELEASQPKTKDVIELHKSELHPLPAMNIDESSIVGNADVIEAIFDELRVLNSEAAAEGSVRTFKEPHDQLVKFFGGDQLSIARLRSLMAIRTGQEGGYSGYGWLVPLHGAFHNKICDTHGNFVTHWGKPNAGTRNPGSLAFHNTRLYRTPIVLTSLPTFRVCRDLIFTSLYARVLHCLLLVSGKATLAEYSASTSSWDDLIGHARAIYERFANAQVVHDLRERRARATRRTLPGQTPPAEGDMVFENAILFLRDALLSRELSDAVKCGDSGRMVLCFKVLALSFRGHGRTKYAHEMLHLIHNLEHVWPKSIRDIVLNNWLVNPTGRPNGWVEIDLMQEHMNFWIKRAYAAHGSAASWDWLEMISPCIDVLRHLSKSMNQSLGSDPTTAHEPADLAADISDLMESLDDHHVYVETKGRILDEDDPPVPDVISIGFQAISDSSNNPLTDYNNTFCKLQIRRRLTPVIGKSDILPPDVASPALVALAEDGRSDDGAQADDEDEAGSDEDEAGEAEQQMEDDDDEGPLLRCDTAADVSLDMDMDGVRGDGQARDSAWYDVDAQSDDDSDGGYDFGM